MSRRILPVTLLVVGVVSGCDAPLQAVSAYPSVLCEVGGERRVRVYGSGFTPDITAKFGGISVTSENLLLVDSHTLEITLPDSARSPAEFPWFPYNDDGVPGLFDTGGEAVLWWDVDVEHSFTSSLGLPELFQTFDDTQLLYEDIKLDRVFVGMEDCDGDGEGDTALTVAGDFFLGYFHTGEEMIGGVGNTVGSFGKVPAYYSAQGRSLYYDTSLYQALHSHPDIAAGKTHYCATHLADGSVNEDATPPPVDDECADVSWDVFEPVESLPFVPWDPYVFRGLLTQDATGDDCPDLLYYNGRYEAPDYFDRDDSYPGYLYNQSFGLFFTLEPLWRYMDPESGEVITSPEKLSGDDLEGLTYLGLDLTRTGDPYYPYILPLSYVELDLAAGGETTRLKSSVGVVSGLYDFSVLMGGYPYYDFTRYEDAGHPRDGSWACVWAGPF